MRIVAHFKISLLLDKISASILHYLTYYAARDILCI